MDGIVTRNEPETEWDEFEQAFYEVKDVTGRPNEPITGSINMVSCFGDNAAAAENPDLVPVDSEGRPATRERDYFDWDYIPIPAIFLHGLGWISMPSPRLSTSTSSRCMILITAPPTGWSHSPAGSAPHWAATTALTTQILSLRFRSNSTRLMSMSTT